MYGLLLQAALEFISSRLSAEIANQILTAAAGGGQRTGTLDDRIGLSKAGFSIHQIYSEKLLLKLAEETSAALNISLDQCLQQLGTFFVRYTTQAGYDHLLRILGRNLGDFVLSLDNLHEYFRGTYPRIKAPSFSVLQEDHYGMVICYRSIRTQLHGYVVGQLTEVARLFYGLKLSITVQAQNIDARGKYSVLLRLDFPNTTYSSIRRPSSIVRFQMPAANSVMSSISEADSKKSSVATKDSPIPSMLRNQKTSPERMFSHITFYIVLNRELEIVSTGKGICHAIHNTIGRDFHEIFELHRPAIPCTWNNILDYSNNVFEIHSLQGIHHASGNKLWSGRESHNKNDSRTERTAATLLRLRGQIIHFEEWDCLMFLAMPIIKNLKELNVLGLKIHDLSMADSSRELIMRKHNIELGTDPLMAQEAKIGSRLDTLVDEANIYRRKRVALLEETIPKFLLRSVEQLAYTYQSDRAVAMACNLHFNKPISSEPILKELIIMLNSICRKFDTVAEKYKMSRVMSFSNEYLAVIGVPFHSNLPANMAILAAEEILDIIEPSTDGRGSVASNAHISYTRKTSKSIITDIQLALDIGSVTGMVMAVTIPRYSACGRPLFVARRLAEIAPPNVCTVTKRIIEALKQNEFITNYDFKSITSILLPDLSDKTDVYVVSSVIRKIKQEEQQDKAKSVSQRVSSLAASRSTTSMSRAKQESAMSSVGGNYHGEHFVNKLANMQDSGSRTTSQSSTLHPPVNRQSPSISVTSPSLLEESEALHAIDSLAGAPAIEFVSTVMRDADEESIEEPRKSCLIQ